MRQQGGSAHGTGSELSVAMHSAEEVVDTEIGEENGGGEDQGVDVVGTVTPQEQETGAVNTEGGDQESDQSPGFFRVPVPVAAPGDVGPDGACDYA